MDLGFVLVLRRPFARVCVEGGWGCDREKGGGDKKKKKKRRKRSSVGTTLVDVEKKKIKFMPSEPQPKRVISTATAPLEERVSAF